MNENEKTIDIVITWVDGNDPDFIRRKNEYLKDRDTDIRDERYRDSGSLKYLLRGIENYAPWVRKVHLVTEGHLPKWLNTGYEKLNVVKHEDFMPAETLPTFNSNAIEMYLHKIPDLSERFIYFNDDMLIIKEVKESDFFVGNKPKDMLALQPVVANPVNPVMSNIFLNNAIVISRHFDKEENIKKNKSKYYHVGYPLKYFIYNFLENAFPLYTSFYTVHGPAPFLKSTFEEVWKKEHDTLYATANNHVRSKDDVSQYLFREWEKQKGNFIPVNLHKDFAYFEIGDDNRKLISCIKGKKKKMICINDTSNDADFDKAVREINEALDKDLPGKSRYEINE